MKTNTIPTGLPPEERLLLQEQEIKRRPVTRGELDAEPDRIEIVYGPYGNNIGKVDCQQAFSQLKVQLSNQLIAVSTDTNKVWAVTRDQGAYYTQKLSKVED